MISVVDFDFNTIHTFKEFYKQCKVKLDLPPFFSNNLDSLWDIITGDIALPVKIVFNNMSPFHKKKFKDLISLFEDAEEELGSSLDFEYVMKFDTDIG